MIGDGDGHAEIVNGHDYTVLFIVVSTLYHCTLCTNTVPPYCLYNTFSTGLQ
jgi:hypothetical protein